MNLKFILKRKKWFKDCYKKIISKQQDYYNKSLSEIYNFDSKVSIFCITIYDVVNNNELNRIVKNLYLLKKNKNYNIEVNCRKKIIKNINYIRPEFDHTGHGIFAKIKFLTDSLISYIDITWSQINNEEAILEYEFNFKKYINNYSQIHEYVYENYRKLEKAKYSVFYFEVDEFFDDDYQKIKLELKYFRTILQQIIGRFSTSKYSKKYLLPVKYTYLVDKQTKKIMKYIKRPFLEESFIIDKEQYLLINSIEDYEGIEIDEVIFKKQFNSINIIALMSELKMKLYYKFFYNIEKQELEYRIGKYLNSKKLWVNILDYKWLINKKRRLNEKRFYDINKRSFKKITAYSNEESSLIEDTLINNIENVYKENIEYINNLNSINYNILAFVISVLALVIAIISIFI